MTVYLDHNAAAPLGRAARTAMAEALEAQANPSSVHGPGRRARALVERAREAVAGAVGARREDVVFTGSGTEACALALRLPGPARVIVAATEHTAVLAHAEGAETAPVDGDGLIDMAVLERMLAAGPALVALMLANNETGTVQPVAEVARLVHDAGGLLAVDCAQAFGKLPVDMAALDADAIMLSAAKIGGPIGVGAAVFRPGLAPKAMIAGGGQERGLRGGSENVVGIAGFGAAVATLQDSLKRQPAIAELRDRMEAAILAAAPEARVAGAGASRLANTSAIAMPGAAAETQVMAFDLAGFAVSAGAACSSGKVAASHVLAAMGLPADQARSTIRVSLGAETTAAEIDSFVQAWRALYMRKNAAQPATETA